MTQITLVAPAAAFITVTLLVASLLTPKKNEAREKPKVNLLTTVGEKMWVSLKLAT